ncbi:MAG TPA: ATP-binding protein [Candidatus Methylomirabilis sp.]|nr:ATP-binding protein [Candidatus Methylomirabilis sp.]
MPRRAHDDHHEADITRARLAAIVDSSDDAIISKDLDGFITSWNRAAERIFGWTEAQAVGQHVTLIIPPERRAEEDHVLARIRCGERVEHFETVHITKSGQLVDVSTSVSPVRDAAGPIVGASTIARDVTERRHIARLLAREQEARREAESLSRTKDQLLATVSHELRTPLNSIFGWARILQGAVTDDGLRMRAINAIVRSASAQARLVEDLLDLARITTGRMRLDFEAMDLNAVTEAALAAVRPAADAKGVALVTALDRSLGTIRGAPDRMQQVVWNLVLNAVKFTPRGGHVEVSVRPAGPMVEVVVRDTGEGIAPELLPHVFEPFRQADSSSTRAHGGLGLGLALVRQLVDLHGGQVRAESVGKGQGSTFTVELPRAAPQPGDRSQMAPMLNGLRVLVVDDDMEALDMSTTSLKETGAEVRAASSAFHAYELINIWQPDVVLTDLAMPGEDGYMLLRALRTAFAGNGTKVPVVALTAYGQSENRARAVQAGFDLYLAKPIDPADLASAIATVARRARQAADDGSSPSFPSPYPDTNPLEPSDS